LGAYFMREVPAKSAARYVHQLQKNATIRGSNAACDSGARVSWRLRIGQDSLDLLENLLILKEILLD